MKLNKPKIYIITLLQELQWLYSNDKLSYHLQSFEIDESMQQILVKSRKLALGETGARKSRNADSLVSIFEGIQQDMPSQYAHPLRAMSLVDDRNFPKKEIITSKQEIDNCIEQFLAAFEKTNWQQASIKDVDLIFSLLEQYTSFLPLNIEKANGQAHLRAVPVYEHIRSAAAIAVALYGYLENTGKNITSIKEGEPVFRIVGAGFSGIQKYIYDIVSKGASRNLKGRSFYLQLLIHTVIQRLLNLPAFGLSKANIIYASGGGFFLLVPNLKDVESILDELKKELQNGLFKESKELLYLGIDSIAFSENLLLSGQIKDLWHRLIEQLNTQKRQKFSARFDADFQELFEPTEQGGLRTRDAITGEEFTIEEEEERDKKLPFNKRILVHYLDKGDDFSQPIKALTNRQIELGRELGKGDYWITSSSPIPINNTNETNPCGLNIYHYFISKETLQKNRSTFTKADIRIIQLNNLEVLDGDLLTEFTMYGGNYLPQKNDRLKTFDELAGDGDFKRLGLLRMDVDNLGQIFVDGFKEEESTLSMYSTLSRSLDFFFKGYLNTIHLKPEYKEDVVILYSGGDDLFILGRWDKIVDMAEEIQTKFKEWVCHNPALTLSGGVAIVTSKYPVIQGATLAQSAEKIAKSFQYPYDGGLSRKNAITLFDYPLNWQQEYPIVKSLKEELIYYVSADNQLIPESIFSKIVDHRARQKYQEANGINPSWLWLLAYDFSQYARKISRRRNDDLDEQAKAFIHRLKDSAVSNRYEGQALNSPYTFLQLLELASRWAHFQRRTEKY